MLLSGGNYLIYLQNLIHILMCYKQSARGNLMKKIGFVLRDLSLAGGTEKCFSLLANQLVRFYDVKAISYYYFDDIFYPLDSKISLENVFPKKGGYRERHILLPRYYSKIRSFLSDCDVIIFVSSASSLGLIATLGWKNKLIITWEHTSLVNEMYLTKKRRLLQYLSVKLSNVCVQLTKYNEEIAKKKWGGSHNIVTIYNPIDDGLFNNNVQCNIESKHIVTLSRIDRVKGLDLLVKVAAKVLKKHPDWKWDVFGQCTDIDYERELKAEIAKSGVEEQLIFHVPVKDIGTVLKNSSIYVMTSYYEGLPMSLLEAKAYGVPIVAFDCPTGPNEIILDGQNGDLIACYDTDDMAKKICDLIENINKRKEYQAMSKIGMDKFSMISVIKKWKELIDGIEV